MRVTRVQLTAGRLMALILLLASGGAILRYAALGRDMGEILGLTACVLVISLLLLPSEKPVSYAFIGGLGGPVLGLLFTLARIGPTGFIWWEGKGGETILTPLGRIIVSIIIAIGAIVGAFCGWAFDARYRPEIAAAKPKSDAPQEYLWDRELDG